MVKVEVLVSTMEQNDMQIYDKMNLQSNAIIINQCDEFRFEEKHIGDKLVRMYSFPERGVGKSRNNALMRADGDICLMADDDMVYVDGYEDVVIRAFENNPRADMIVFNVRVHEQNGVSERVRRRQRVRRFNCLRYGTVSFAFRRNSILKANAFFSLLFGGGAKYGSGEDSLFIWTSIKSGLRVITEKTVIADVYNSKSTWFRGYTERYFFDKGALFACLSERLSSLLILQFALRKRSLYAGHIDIIKAVRMMLMGAKEFKLGSKST